MGNPGNILLSFVIIGRNEEKNIERCVKGIYKGIEAAGIATYEIIYVDSKSTDKSIEVAARFPEVRIFSVTGGCNAAVGRNIGALQATGRAIFFVDADMEIYPEFLVNAWDREAGNINGDIIAGQWLDIVEPKPEKRRSSKVFPGGTFLIRREVWESVGGMRTRFKTGEESDLGLRLMKKGYRVIRKDEFIVKHYTVPYLGRARIWRAIWSKAVFYSRCVMLRNHLFDKNMYSLLWRIDKTFLVFTLALIASIVYPPVGLAFWGAYLLAVLLRVRKSRRELSFLEMTAYYIVSDALNLVYFFTFFPPNIKLEYVPVREKALQPAEA